ncbi:MAG: metallophosphoesterase [Chloroflexi bacterium]|nr:metallophosphoesterase [Chloroflexota bacterium]
MSSSSPGRQFGLLIIVFVASIALLGGGLALFSRSTAGGSALPRASTIAVASPATSPSASSSAKPGGSGPSAGSSIGPGGSEQPIVVLTGAGDIGTCGLAGAQKTSDLLVKQEGSIFTVGDNAYENGSAEDYAACYAPTWGRVFERTILPVAGNHDWNTDGAAGYRAYFGAAAAGPGGATWYSKDLGAWHVVVLDSNCAKVGGCDATSAQGKWLAADLAASDARCTLALWHHPRFSSGEHGNDPLVGPFWDLLHAAGADLIVNGHDHDYERFAQQDPAGGELRPGGIREIVVGTGGVGLRSFKATVANSEFRLAGSFGVLRLTLHPVNYDWEFLPVAGSITDFGSTPCH